MHAFGTDRIQLPQVIRLLCLPLAGALVFSLFSAAPSIGGMIPSPWDKLAHLAFYGGIGGLLAIALRSWSFWWPILATCAIGVADEFYQSTLPGRVASVDDLIFDVVAAILATMFVYRTTRP